MSVLRTKDIIAVNGSAQYLLSNNIVPFIYVLTDVRFLHQRRDDFYKFSQRSRYTIVNVDVYEHASKEDKLYILQNCLVLRSFYRREKGGFIKKIKFNILRQIHKELLISVPLSKKVVWLDFARTLVLVITHAILLPLLQFKSHIHLSMRGLFVLVLI